MSATTIRNTRCPSRVGDLYLSVKQETRFSLTWEIWKAISYNLSITKSSAMVLSCLDWLETFHLKQDLFHTGGKVTAPSMKDHYLQWKGFLNSGWGHVISLQLGEVSRDWLVSLFWICWSCWSLKKKTLSLVNWSSQLGIHNQLQLPSASLFQLFLMHVLMSTVLPRSDCSAWLPRWGDGELGSDHIQGDGAALRPSQILRWEQRESCICNRPWTRTYGTHKLSAKWLSSSSVYFSNTGNI